MSKNTITRLRGPKEYDLLFLTNSHEDEIAIVEPDVIPWINSPRPAYFDESNTGLDMVPGTILHRLQEYADNNNERVLPFRVSSGSPENDRALLACCALTVVIENYTCRFTELVDALHFIHKNGVRIMNVYEGVIY